VKSQARQGWHICRFVEQQTKKIPAPAGRHISKMPLLNEAWFIGGYKVSTNMPALSALFGFVFLL
jgi:hypothetical protein